jgi:phosphoserine phosphatase RsbU/P
MLNLPPALANVILDTFGEGVYVCDLDRKILYWNKAAVRITGWSAAEVVGRHCHDNILCHIDKDGHRLCGKEFCPLHRCMVTGNPSNVPMIIFPQGKDGRRIATQAWVAPIRDAQDHVIGGIETFRDVSATFADLERAKQIQTLSLERELPEDRRIRVDAFYTPQDIVGGDYFAIRPLEGDLYGFLLADAMGHGFAAALHTMYISSLWGRFCHLLHKPGHFAAKMNKELTKIVKDESFATAVCGVVDIKKRIVRFAAAGGPPVVVLQVDGEYQQIKCPGFPFGVQADAEYQEQEVQFAPGDCLLLLTDGAEEIRNADGNALGIEGLIRILQRLGYPKSMIRKESLDEELLKFSNAIRLEDDVTLIGVTFLE